MKITSHPSFYKTEFALQHNGISIQEAEAQLAAMKGVTAYSFGLIPFSDEIVTEWVPNDRPIVPLGGTKLIGLYQRAITPDNWVVFYDETNFDQAHYKQLLGPELLNANAELVSLQDVMDMQFKDDVFVKPSDDLKMFAGTMIEAGQTLRDALLEMHHQELDQTKQILVAPKQQLYREYRVIVVNGVPTGFSQYKDHTGKVKASVLPLVERDKLYFKALQLHNHWHPAPVYTIDFAEVGPSRLLKVVEYNCFNCSGLYKVDRNAVYREIAKYVDSCL